MAISTDAAKPGSDAALALGCKCPRLDNCHGVGYMASGLSNGPTLFVIDARCPLHGTPDLDTLAAGVTWQPVEYDDIFTPNGDPIDAEHVGICEAWIDFGIASPSENFAIFRRTTTPQPATVPGAMPVPDDVREHLETIEAALLRYEYMHDKFLEPAMTAKAQAALVAVRAWLDQRSAQGAGGVG